MKIGILGGTFDPPHIGHYIVGSQVLNQLNLRKIIFIPTGLSYHKSEIKKITPSNIRLLLSNIAFSEEENFLVSDVDVKREGSTFAVDTLKDIKELNPEYEIFYIVGLDTFNTILNWKNYELLFKLAKIVVVNRPNYEKDTHVVDKLTSDQINNLIFLKIPNIDVSSTSIREMIKDKKSVKYLMPEKIIKYINDNKIY